MKPLKLAMSAFGSYADVQEIDFTELGSNGLYLITGETGSGKTTIFDAISFALFGKASGAGRDDYSMLRSDFAAEKTKTYVALDFISGDNRYNIKRTIKKTGQEVVLVLPDGTSMSGDRNIKPKIAEIVGLDRDQFAQIVMIAQNDFLRFLQSGTEERLKILRRIFGTEALKQFQEQLKSLAKRESGKRALLLHDFERYEVDVYKRNEQFMEWETQIKSDTSGLLEVNQKLDRYDKQKQHLAGRLALAEELGKKFTDLAKYRCDREAHDARNGEIVVIKKRAACGEIALYKVKPFYDEAQKTTMNHSAAETGLIKAKEQETAAIEESEETMKMIESLPPLAEVQEAFAVLLKEWETVTINLTRLTDLQTRRNEIIDKHVILAGKQEDLNRTLDWLSRLPSIDDCQTELDQLTNDLKDKEEKLTKLSVLQNDFTIIVDKQKELSREQREFEALNLGFKDANERHRALEEAFLRSQAGIIARTLADGEPCPVCGSAEHPAPAEIPGDSVTEAKLKKASEAKDKVQSKRETQSSVCGALKSEIDTLLKRFIADLLPMIPDATIDSASTLLVKNISLTQSAMRELSQMRSVSINSLSELRAAFENDTKKRDQLYPIIASIQSEIDTLIKRFLDDISVYLPDTNWNASESKLAGLLSQTQNLADELTKRKEKDKIMCDQLSENWDVVIKRRVKADSAVQSAQTLLTERTANEQTLLKLRDEAQSTYKTVLQVNSFTDDADYKTALITEDELVELKKRISSYDKKREQLILNISRLESETTDKEQPDLECLRKEADRANLDYKMLSEKRDEINGRLSKTISALEELRRAASDFDKVERAYADVKQLADTANGKLDFETYAQMAYFERVIRSANFRLKVMSQNRYTLLRKTDRDDGRRRSGLELEVLDAYTGKTRSANSLSGGESFMASLSLALGLSDVVQQSAGGIRLDAMFIDEGFGTLDADVLELATRTLSEMAGASRIVGIISHVTELRERIEKQVLVEKSTAGSKIRIAK